MMDLPSTECAQEAARLAPLQSPATARSVQPINLKMVHEHATQPQGQHSVANAASAWVGPLPQWRRACAGCEQAKLATRARTERAREALPARGPPHGQNPGRGLDAHWHWQGPGAPGGCR